MDLCRGSLLAQPWSDTPWLSPPERKQMAEFIALLKAQPGCFGNSRFILGDPWKDEPYGYCCTDGKRAFLAIHNCCWKDTVPRLELNSAWGLPDGQAWDLYRWYPDPAKLSHQQETFGNTASIPLRPFEIVLLEAVPHGQAPTLDRRFDCKPIPTTFAEPSRSLDLAVEEVGREKRPEHGKAVPGKSRLSATTAEPPLPSPKPSGPRSLVVKGQVPPSPSGGNLVITVEMKRGSQPMRIGGPGKFLTAQGTLASQTAACEPVVGTATHPCCWQAWRIAAGPSSQPQPFELSIIANLGLDVQLASHGYFIPSHFNSIAGCSENDISP